MSPTQFAVQKADAYCRFEAARKAGFLTEMQRIAGELTQLNYSYYGYSR